MKTLNMNEHLCSRELTATSVVSLEDALNSALQRASRSAKNLRTIHILEKGRHFDENHIPRWQVTLHVGMSA
jgi:flavin-binding protein dodecin